MGIVKGKAVGKWSRPMYQEGHQAWTTIRLARISHQPVGIRLHPSI
jgi:hypothetical protein